MSKPAASNGWMCVFSIAPVILIALTLFAIYPAGQRPTDGGPIAAIGLPSSVSPSAQAKIRAGFAVLPLAFEQNQGQTDSQVKYLARGSGYTVFLTATDTVFSFHSRKTSSKSSSTRRDAQAEKSAVVRMQLVGGNAGARVSASDPVAGKSNYFIGNDPSKWRTDVPRYERVSYQDVYPGVNLAFHGAQRQLEFDFLVAPGADPAPIGFHFAGNQGMKTDSGGNLLVSSVAGNVLLHKPVAFQEVNGTRQLVDARFALNAKNQVGFELGEYDHSRELVIDPAISYGYSTYLGGSLEDDGYAIAFDSSGNAYVTGETDSTTFPGAPTGYVGGFDVFVSKIAANGASLVYSTYIGGTADDSGNGIAVDSSNNAYVVGGTSSTNFPSTQGAYQTTMGAAGNAFILKLNPSGTVLLYSTYLGGTGTGSDTALGMALDSTGNVFAVGSTNTGNFPNVGALQTAPAGGFLAKLTPAGGGASDLQFSTYMGGGPNDLAIAVALDSTGDPFVTGQTAGSLAVTTGSFQPNFGGGLADAFVSAIKSDGSAYIYSTYVGGTGDDAGNGIAVDSAGDAYITGETSGGFPLQSAAQTAVGGPFDAFVTKLNASGSALIYSTYLGGSQSEVGAAIAVDGSGNAYVTGQTTSADFPLKSPTQATFGGGSSNAFVSEYNATGSLAFSTYLGGSVGEDTTGKFGSIAVDSLGATVYVTGNTESPDFFTTGALQPTFAGGAADAFVVKYTQQTFTVAATPPTPTPVSAGTPTTSTVTLTAVNGYNSGVNLACAVTGTGTPPPACSASSFSPASPITPTAGGAQTTLTITTTAATAENFFSRKTFYAMWLPVLGISFVGMSFNSSRSLRKKLMGLLMIGMATAALLLMPACGGGSSGGGGGGGGGGGTGGTPKGSYTVTITATGTDAAATTQSTQVTVTVN